MKRFLIFHFFEVLVVTLHFEPSFHLIGDLRLGGDLDLFLGGDLLSGGRGGLECEIVIPP